MEPAVSGKFFRDHYNTRKARTSIPHHKHDSQESQPPSCKHEKHKSSNVVTEVWPLAETSTRLKALAESTEIQLKLRRTHTDSSRVGLRWGSRIGNIGNIDTTTCRSFLYKFNEFNIIRADPGKMGHPGEMGQAIPGCIDCVICRA